jgi:hypothetical protein
MIDATPAISELLERARRLASTGQEAAATTAYLELLRHDPTHFAALNELGTLAFESDYLSAAYTAYSQAVRRHPQNPIGRVNLGNLLHKKGEIAAARAQYEAALATTADLAEAHQGLARILDELGETVAAEPHWRKGFAGRAAVAQRYRGTAHAVPVLLLVSAKGGNIPTRRILDDRVFGVTALYAEFYDPALPLPPHRLVFNAIGDADLCLAALACAEDVVARTAVPVINPPHQVRMTNRVANTWRLAKLPGVVAPSIRSIARSALQSPDEWTFPLLLRAPGFHTGQHFLRVEQREDLAPAVAILPGHELLVLEYLDARGADGMWRKYRVMIIDGILYPLHLAISTDWKVHYFTADMTANAAYREEEQRFLEDMATVLGLKALSAIEEIGRCLGLDYAGIDFGLRPDGAVLLFEANATMVVYPPDPDPIWDYRRTPIGRVIDAVKRMLLAKAMTPRA